MEWSLQLGFLLSVGSGKRNIGVRSGRSLREEGGEGREGERYKKSRHDGVVEGVGRKEMDRGKGKGLTKEAATINIK